MLFLYLLIIILIAYLLFWPRGSARKKTARSNPNQPRRLFKDPVCGVYVDEEEAVKLTWKNETVYFCSKECRDKFLQQKKSN